jgi:hypothetical protein
VLLSFFSESNSSYLAHLLSSAMYGPTGTGTGSGSGIHNKDGAEGGEQKGGQCFLKVSSPDDVELNSFDLVLE